MDSIPSFISKNINSYTSPPYPQFCFPQFQLPSVIQLWDCPQSNAGERLCWCSLCAATTPYSRRLVIPWDCWMKTQKCWPPPHLSCPLLPDLRLESTFGQFNIQTTQGRGTWDTNLKLDQTKHRLVQPQALGKGSWPGTHLLSWVMLSSRLILDFQCLYNGQRCQTSSLLEIVITSCTM